MLEVITCAHACARCPRDEVKACAHACAQCPRDEVKGWAEPVANSTARRDHHPSLYRKMRPSITLPQDKMTPSFYRKMRAKCQCTKCHCPALSCMDTVDHKDPICYILWIIMIQPVALLDLKGPDPDPGFLNPRHGSTATAIHPSLSLAPNSISVGQ